MAVYQKVYITEKSQSVASNESVVNILWESQQTGQSYNGYAKDAEYWVTVNGVEQAEPTTGKFALPANTTVMLANIDIAVPHLADGTATVIVRTRMDTGIPSAGVVELTESRTLTTIPRGATITSAPNFTDLDSPTVYFINPAGDAASSLEICISISGNTDVSNHDDVPYFSIQNKNATQYTFAFGAQDLTALRESATGTPPTQTLYFILKTTIDDNIFYSKLARDFRVTETADTKPSINSIAVTPENGVLPNAFNGLFIYGKSKAVVNIDATAKYNANLEDCVIIVDGKSYHGTSIESAFLMNDGKNTISVEVKDSRGFTATSTTEIIVLPYSSPTIANMPGETSLSCYRANKDGTPNDSGINVYVKVARAYSKIVVDSVQKNFCDMEWRCKNRFDVWSDQEWYPMIARDENTRDWFSAILIDNIEEQPVVFETSQSYTVQIRVKDDIGDFSAIDLDVFREAVDLHLGGNCLGIGRYADQSMPFSVKIDERWTVFFGETDIKDIFLNISHPVGAYLHTDNSANPGETIGGTWELINSDTEYIWKRTA